MGVIDDLISQIAKLPRSDKALLVDVIVRDMVSSDPEIDKVWLKRLHYVGTTTSRVLLNPYLTLK